MNLEEANFYSAIAEGLRQHPEWLRTAIAAVSDGMEATLRQANQRAAKLDMGLRCALGLAEPGRLNADAKAVLTKGVLNALPPDEGCSEVERKARARLSKEAQAAGEP